LEPLDPEKSIEPLRRLAVTTLAVIACIAVVQGLIVAVHLVAGDVFAGVALQADRVALIAGSVAIAAGCYVIYRGVVVPGVRRGYDANQRRLDIQRRIAVGEARIRSLYTIASSNVADLNTQIDNALAMGALGLEMRYGFLSRVEGGRLTIRNQFGEATGFPIGHSVPLAGALVRHVYGTRRAIAENDLTAEPWATETKAGDVPWLSFIGATVFVEDASYGTLTFSDTAVRGHPFEQTDLDFIDLIATLIGTIVARERRQSELHAKAFRDVLTGLANRALFEEHLEEAIVRARRGGEQVALHFVDLNDFKPVNDTYGHLAGDDVLREVARRLSAASRAHDVVARVGGDEFVVLQTGIIGLETAEQLGNRLRASLSSPIELQNGFSVPMSASFGLALYPRDATDARGLLQRADAAMYAAKREVIRRVNGSGGVRSA